MRLFLDTSLAVRQHLSQPKAHVTETSPAV